MNLNKPAKIILGVLTFLPLIFGIVSFGIAIYQVFSMVFSEDPTMPMLLLSYLTYVLPYLFIFFLIYLGLGIFYLVHIIQNNYLDTEKRILWIVVLITLHTFSMPVYWYAHIWRDKPTVKSEFDTGLDTSHESGIESQKF